MDLRVATFNVLADAYIGYGDYSYVDPNLLANGARTPGLLRVIEDLGVDVIGLQEVEAPLRDALEDTGNWQSFWTPKGRNKLDGCLTLVRHGVDVDDFHSRYFSDESGHVMQMLRIGQTVLANTHIKWAPMDDPNHAGVYQTQELLHQIDSEQPAVILGDYNDQPGGPVRELVRNAGFVNVYKDEATAFVNKGAVALDLLAVRGISATLVNASYRAINIPDALCPSDHIPVVANIEVR